LASASIAPILSNRFLRHTGLRGVTFEFRIAIHLLPGDLAIRYSIEAFNELASVAEPENVHDPVFRLT
jgi:hypothetical protein